MKIDNGAQGKIFYGIHFYPGVAQYSDEGKEPYRIFLNEDTIRKMNPSYAGRPVFVEHVEDVTSDLKELKKEADGWVVESFYNSADGKTWVKFIIVSDLAEQAIKNGYGLSNSYFPKAFGPGGLWNGIQYAKEITEGEYEHLAIVKTPRYEESKILTPEQFKKYNEEKELDLKRLKNSRSVPMFDFFKKTKVENAVDIEGMSVILPKTKLEVRLEKLINDADESEEKKMANPEHHVMLGEKKIKVNDLLKKHNDLLHEHEMLKEEHAKNCSNDEAEKKKEDGASEGDEKVKEEAKDIVKHEEKEIKEEEGEGKKKNEVDHFERLKNAPNKNELPEIAFAGLPCDQLARGRKFFGSEK